MSFKDSLIRKAREAIRSEDLVRPKRVEVYERKKFPKSLDGQYGEANVRQRVGRPVTSASMIYVRRTPAKGLRLTNDELKQAMAHEISHLKYANHTEHQRDYAKKIYKKYLS